MRPRDLGGRECVGCGRWFVPVRPQQVACRPSCRARRSGRDGKPMRLNKLPGGQEVCREGTVWTGR